MKKSKSKNRKGQKSDAIGEELLGFSDKMDAARTLNIVLNKQKGHYLLDEKRIVDFVNAIETRKGFLRNPDLIFRHMVSEMGELDAAMHRHSNAAGRGILEAMENIADELLDIIFLACYMADVFGVGLNRRAPHRVNEIDLKYS